MQLLAFLRTSGQYKEDRTGTGTYSNFGHQGMTFELHDGENMLVPIPSTKKVLHDKYITELVWMLSGSSRVEFLLKNGVNIWNEWIIPGTEVYGRELGLEERITECKRMGLRDEFNKFRAHSTDLEWMEAQDKWLDDKGVPKRQLIDGDLGPVYGSQWRNWQDIRIVAERESTGHHVEDMNKRGFRFVDKISYDYMSPARVYARHIDQIAQIEDQLANNPFSRRIILSAWNVGRIDEMALPPCHTLAQWGVTEVKGERILDCKLYQRSADIFLGVPFNFGFYAVLTHMFAAKANMRAGKLYHTFGDVHLYSNHVEQADRQLAREVNMESYPILKLNGVKSAVDYTLDDIQIEGYKPQGFIKAPVAV